MAELKFIVTIRDYEAADPEASLDANMIEAAISNVLDNDGDDGIVIVEDRSVGWTARAGS